MADLSIQDQVKLKRGAFASTTTMRTNILDIPDDDMHPDSSDDNMPPPPPPPPPMPKKSQRNRNDIFDLRPKSMIEEGDSVGKPHIDVLGEGINLPNVSNISALELQDFRKKLRPVKRREPISKKTDAPSIANKAIAQKGKNHSNYKENGPRLTNEKQQPKRKDSMLSRAMSDSEVSDPDDHEVYPSDNRRIRSNKRKEPTNLTRTRQDHDEIIQPEDSISQIISKPATQIKTSRRRSLVDTIIDQDDEDERRTDISTGSTRGRPIMKSSKQRSPSICFSFPNGNESISEVSDDDLVKDVKQRPAYGSFQFICNELNIREPFTEPELNVLHTMCEEYVQIANLTFAKKKFFVRSLPHEERVYNFLGSRKKSGWLEKADVGQGVMSSKTLEFLFSVTIRRRSRRIDGETLNLKGFTKGRTLTVARFSTIMRDAFMRREYLFNCAVGRLHAYTEIK